MNNNEKDKIVSQARGIIKDLIDKGYTKYQIAKETGIAEKTIGNYVNGVNKPSFANSQVIIRYYSGEGEMLKSDKPKYNEVTPREEGDYMMVEYADLRASAGELGCGDVELLPETHKRLLPKEYASGKYMVVRVDGTSMNDGLEHSLSDGDEVLIRLNENGIKTDDLPIKKTVFVITTRDGNVLKQIKEINKDQSYIVCHSWNPKYEDFKIKFEDIYQIFTVYKIVQKQISLI